MKMQNINLLHHFINLFATVNILILLSGALAARHNATREDDDTVDLQNGVVISRTITVDKSGHGNFTTIQKAIDSIPIDNNLWVRIRLTPGIYTEKVLINGKQYIYLEGESSRTTTIAWGDGGSVVESPSFNLLADNFVGRGITFKNTYNHVLAMERKITWAPAAAIAGDKVSFYECGFIGTQDTLSDARGRHYFQSCYIEGAMDFIWGNGQSFYERCNLNVSTSLLGPGRHTSYITAQGRQSEDESSGFVFCFCNVIGKGPAFLGRAYRSHSRVLFYKTNMNNIIVPKGWSAWEQTGHEDLITFAEVGCYGPGANKRGRVDWEKELSVSEWQKLIKINSFINQDGWLQKQPIKPALNAV